MLTGSLRGALAPLFEISPLPLVNQVGYIREASPLLDSPFASLPLLLVNEVGCLREASALLGLSLCVSTLALG